MFREKSKTIMSFQTEKKKGTRVDSSFHTLRGFIPSGGFYRFFREYTSGHSLLLEPCKAKGYKLGVPKPSMPSSQVINFQRKKNLNV